MEGDGALGIPFFFRRFLNRKTYAVLQKIVQNEKNNWIVQTKISFRLVWS